MTEVKRADLIRDVAVGLTLAISLGSAAMTVIDRTTGSAKSAEQLDGRLAIVEREAEAHRVTIRSNARFANEATNQLNFLCYRTAECRALYAPIAVPE